jgi:hypothetical protein
MAGKQDPQFELLPETQKLFLSHPESASEAVTRANTLKQMS